MPESIWQPTHTYNGIVFGVALGYGVQSTDPKFFSNFELFGICVVHLLKCRKYHVHPEKYHKISRKVGN